MELNYKGKKYEIMCDKTYDINFDVTLNDDRNLTGSYSGAVQGSPKE